MTEALLTLCFFLFVMAAVGVALLLFRWTGGRRLADGSIELPKDLKHKPIESGLVNTMYVIGEVAPRKKGGQASPRERLIAAGFRAPHAEAVFNGAKVAVALLLALVLGWVGLLDHESLVMSFVLAVCGAGFGYMLPERLLDRMAHRRGEKLERALPNALDLMVLSVEAGQSLDSALIETSRELRHIYPELSAEFGQVQVETRAGRSRSEVLYALGQRTNSVEIRKLATVLIDCDRFGTSIGPALRTHARFLRLRRRQEAQESARKLSVKLIFPVFFLIMPSVFVVTLGPAVLSFSEAMVMMVGGG